MQQPCTRVSIDGGEVVELTGQTVYPPSVSPDGKLVAFFAAKEKGSGLLVIPAAGGAPVKTFDILPNHRFLQFTMITRWAEGGNLLTYIDNHREVSNIWGLPVRGGSPRRLTGFNTASIFSFDWSRDGRQLVLARENSPIRSYYSATPNDGSTVYSDNAPAVARLANTLLSTCQKY